MNAFLEEWVKKNSLSWWKLFAEEFNLLQLQREDLKDIKQCALRMGCHVCENVKLENVWWKDSFVKLSPNSFNIKTNDKSYTCNF